MCAHKTPHSQGLFSTNQGTKSYNFTWKSSVFSLSSSLRNTPTVCAKVGNHRRKSFAFFVFGWSGHSHPHALITEQNPLSLSKKPLMFGHIWVSENWSSGLCAHVLKLCFVTFLWHLWVSVARNGSTFRPMYLTSKKRKQQRIWQAPMMLNSRTFQWWKTMWWRGRPGFVRCYAIHTLHFCLGKNPAVAHG